MYYCCGITEKGVMPHNEDALLAGGIVLTAGSIEKRMEPPFVAAVSDGVSGENAGEVASSMCLELLKGLTDLNEDKLKNGLLNIHEKLAEHGRNNASNRNMQATLCGIAVLEDDIVVTYNVGDSRLYRYRDGVIRQLSRDQSLVQLLYEEGSISREELRTHAQRHIIFPVLGNIKDKPRIDTDVIKGGFAHGDVLLICSDGLSDTLSPIEIQEIMELPKSLHKRLTLLVRTALERGGTDNITIAAVVKEN